MVKRFDPVEYYDQGGDGLGQMEECKDGDYVTLEDFTKLNDLCREFFVDAMVQPYAGANRECMYCGATERRDGSVDHSPADCPIVKYGELGL